MKKMVLVILAALALTSCENTKEWDAWACEATGKAFYTRVDANGDGVALIYDEKVEGIHRAGNVWEFQSVRDPGYVGRIVFHDDTATISAEDIRIDPPELEWEFTCKHTAKVAL